ncbi:hydroxyacid dehydrogenase [Kitasatospora sp. NPDC004745]|uniref:hydroxyacid dehydrogenase n=1 Tax=unclassified Kitasatospora TaxID=2633591 RepID=UPI0033EF6CF0
MDQPVVLIADPLPAETVAGLGPGFDVRHCVGADRAALLAAVPAADALIIRSATRVDREVIEAAPRLRIVARAGVGLDNVDTAAAAAAGVAVANAPESNTTSVAELVVGLIIASLRRIPAATASVRAGEWQRAAFGGTELAGKTVGILGFGRIGRLVARRLAAFDMRIECHDPYVSAEAAAEHGAHAVPLDELMRNADVLTVHLPRTPETVGIVGDAELRLAKPGLLVVNTSRGGIVDEAALALALKEQRIAGAALDVFEIEPPLGSPLVGLDTVLATPHIGAGTREAQLRAGQDAVRAVRAALSGGPGAAGR